MRRRCSLYYSYRSAARRNLGPLATFFRASLGPGLRRDDASTLTLPSFKRRNEFAALLSNAGKPGQVLVKLDIGGTPLIARITERSRKHLKIEPGRRLWAQVKSVALLR